MTRTHIRPLYRAGALALAAALFASSLPAPADAGPPLSKRTRVEIHTTIALPGVVLSPGPYTFEQVNVHSSLRTVLVRSDGLGRRPVFLGFTRTVERPRHLPSDQMFVFGEAPAGEPIPIAAWYPEGATGYEFIYRN